MYSLYINDAGQNRFDVIRLLTAEYLATWAEAKMILAHMKTRILAGEIAQLRKLQERLDAMGAETVIEVFTEDIDEPS
jgi:hypothetical protein